MRFTVTKTQTGRPYRAIIEVERGILHLDFRGTVDGNEDEVIAKLPQDVQDAINVVLGYKMKKAGVKVDDKSVTQAQLAESLSAHFKAVQPVESERSVL